MLICPSCRAENAADSARCAKCGSALPVLDDMETLAGGGAAAESAHEPRSPSTIATTVTQSPGSRASIGAGFSAPNYAPSATVLAPGSDFGPRYRIDSQLGEGGMGTVYKAFDRDLDRVVALKLLRQEMVSDSSALKRFKQELLLASRISHRNILRIHDLGDVGGLKFISMAYVEGEDLRATLDREGKLAIDKVVDLLRQVCGALEEAHKAGVVHRDLKPHNILVDKSGVAYISDFGLAKSLEAGAMGMTRSGEYLGTPRYMSPEQVEGGTIDQRTDIYALGVMLYELVTGDAPFTGDSTLQVMFKRVKERPKDPKLRRPDLPTHLSRIILKCMEKDPAHRYQSAREIIADLDAQRAPSRSVRAALPEIAEKKWVWAVVPVTLLLLLLAIPAVRRAIFSGPKVPTASVPVTVLVADFTNHTGDPIFDDTLEPMVNLAIEGASFINAFNRENARKLARKLPQASEKLDEQVARLVAVNQGISAVLAGEISRRGDEYRLSITALDSVTGNVLAQATVAAANKDEVLLGIPKLAAPIRKGLGDSTPESVQVEKAAGAFTAANLEAVHQYGIGKKQEAAGEFAEALRSYSKAAELDPNFARAYGSMSAMSGNLGRLEDAEKYVKLAMERVDRMTERERYRVRGLYYFTMGDWQKCVEEYSELVKQYPADNLGHYNLSGCYMAMRNVGQAVAAARQAVEIEPQSALLRLNLSFFTSYAGDFQTAEEEARKAVGLSTSPIAYLALVETQLGQQKIAEAAETYRKQAELGEMGSSMASSGLADLAVYEGRFADAAKILEQGAAKDLAAENRETAADKLAALSQVQLLRGQKAAAVTAAERALANGQAIPVRFLAARTFVEAGEAAKAQKLAASLGSDLQDEPQSYAKIIEGMIALKRGDTRQAIATLTEANKLFDTWISRFELGRAYLEAGLFVEASSEFDRCVERRGEAIELFMNNVPTIGYFPMIYYYQGRVREGLKSSGFADSYQTYLSIRGKSSEDPLLPEIRRRIGQ